MVAGSPLRDDRTAGEDWVLVLIAIFVFVGSVTAGLLIWCFLITWR